LPAPDGSDNIKGKGLANCLDCGSEWDEWKAAPAGQFPSNSWGLQDMHGNIFEWVEDWVHPTARLNYLGFRVVCSSPIFGH
jgi:formylglycine-generating enzyme required for sulfatase activity